MHSHRALVTGITGFAGGFLAEHLLDLGDAVLGCSPDGTWMDSSPQTLRTKLDLVAWDLAKPTGLDTESRVRIAQFEPDVVYHLAAISVPEDCGEAEPNALAMAVNVEGTRRVAALAVSLPRRPRLVFTSSSYVYAPASADSPYVDENAPCQPSRAYGRTKLAAEESLLTAAQRQGCNVVIVRAFQHTGPRQSPRMMLPQWARQFAAGGTEPVEVYTKDAWIDLTDVRDVVRAYRLLAEHGRSGEVYNVGSGVRRRSGDVLEILQAMADPQRPVVQLQPGVKQDAIADITRLTRSTGWRAIVPLEQTVADTLAYWRASCHREEL